MYGSAMRSHFSFSVFFFTVFPVIFPVIFPVVFPVVIVVLVFLSVLVHILLLSNYSPFIMFSLAICIIRFTI